MQIIHKKKQKKKRKICRKKIGVCLLLPPNMSVPATTKIFFRFVSSMLLICVSGYVPSSVRLPSRPVCACCNSLWSSGPKHFCFPPVQDTQSIPVMLPSRPVCACCNSLWSSRPKRFRFPPVQDTQSIPVTLPLRPVCACCNSLWSSGPKRFCFPPVSYAKYFSYASIKTGVRLL